MHFLIWCHFDYYQKKNQVWLHFVIPQFAICVKTHIFGRVTSVAFPQNFQTRKLDKISVILCNSFVTKVKKRKVQCKFSGEDHHYERVKHARNHGQFQAAKSGVSWKNIIGNLRHQKVIILLKRALRICLREGLFNIRSFNRWRSLKIFNNSLFICMFIYLFFYLFLYLFINYLLIIYSFIKTLFKSKINHEIDKNMYKVNRKYNIFNTVSTLHKSLTVG